MTKEQMMYIAKRNLERAEYSLRHNSIRKGVTDDEIQHLSDKLEYAKTVYELIINNMQ